MYTYMYIKTYLKQVLLNHSRKKSCKTLSLLDSAKKFMLQQ